MCRDGQIRLQAESILKKEDTISIIRPRLDKMTQMKIVTIESINMT